MGMDVDSTKPDGEGHPIYNVTMADLRPSASISVITDQDGTTSILPGNTDEIRFEVWFRGQKGSRPTTWEEFLDYVTACGITNEFEIAKIEAGMPFRTQEGWIRFIRVSP